MSAKLTPFAVLQQLEQRATSLAAPLPDQAGETKSFQAIAFEFMGDTFLMPMTDVKEVLPMPVTRRLPGVQKWVKGIANVRGEILALIDLNAFLSSGKMTNPAVSRIIAIETDGMHFGIIVDRVIGMRQVSQAQIKEGPAGNCPSEMLGYIAASVDLENQSMNLFCPVKLVNSDTFATVSTL